MLEKEQPIIPPEKSLLKWCRMNSESRDQLMKLEGENDYQDIYILEDCLLSSEKYLTTLLKYTMVELAVRRLIDKPEYPKVVSSEGKHSPIKTSLGNVTISHKETDIQQRVITFSRHENATEDEYQKAVKMIIAETNGLLEMFGEPLIPSIDVKKVTLK